MLSLWWGLPMPVRLGWAVRVAGFRQNETPSLMGGSWTCHGQ